MEFEVELSWVNESIINAVLWITTRPLANATKICCGRIGIQNPFAHMASDFFLLKGHAHLHFNFFEKTLHQPRLIVVSCSKTCNVALYWKSLPSPRRERPTKIVITVYERSWTFYNKRWELIDLGWKIPLAHLITETLVSCLKSSKDCSHFIFAYFLWN